MEPGLLSTKKKPRASNSVRPKKITQGKGGILKSHRKKGGLIAFSGLDGAGKTTLTRSLCQHLAERGFPHTYIWCKFDSFFLDIGRKMSKGQSQRKERGEKRLPDHPLVSSLYRFLIVTLYAVRIMRLASTQIRVGSLVIADRYMHDTIVDLALEFNLSEKAQTRMTSMASALIPKPDLHFWLDVPESVALSRKPDEDTTLQALERKKKLYKAVFRLSSSNLVSLKGTAPVPELNETIQSYVERACL